MINSELVSVPPHDALEKKSTDCRHLVPEQSTLGIPDTFLNTRKLFCHFSKIAMIKKKKKMCVLFMCMF